MSVYLLLLFCDVVKQFPSPTVLHHKEEILGRLDDFVELNEVRMSHKFEDVNLSGDPFDI
jgi:hypothetical protein